MKTPHYPLMHATNLQGKRGTRPHERQQLHLPGYMPAELPDIAALMRLIKSCSGSAPGIYVRIGLPWLAISVKKGHLEKKASLPHCIPVASPIPCSRKRGSDIGVNPT